MATIQEQPLSDNNEVQVEAPSSQPAPRSCPIDHSAFSWQKTVPGAISDGPAVEEAADGVWHVRNFETARAVLRSTDTKQAGFGAELLDQSTSMINKPIVYLEGKEHQKQRKATARFFAPKVVSDNYRRVMERVTDQLIRKVKRKKQVDLSQLSITMAVRVAGHVVGLTNSFPGLAQRLEALFAGGDLTSFKFTPSGIIQILKSQYSILAFYNLDVAPAIRARKRKPQNDVISHLLSQNYNKVEILTECLVYGAAGMVTTREFISVAAWHILERPELHKRYLAGSEEERYAILHEILRLEPVVTRLQRRTTAPVNVVDNGQSYTIPEGVKVEVEIDASNTDESVVGELPLAVCPGREITGDRIPEMLLSFGDGIHRCPGAYIAIQETDIFLSRLLALDGIHIVSKPSIRWNKITTGYELRNFEIGVN